MTDGRYFAPVKVPIKMRFSVRRAGLILSFAAIWVPTLGMAQPGRSVSAVTPIFGQLVMLSYPRGFKPAHENNSGSYYIQESVLEGESVANWSQMITLTGSKELASNPNLSPQAVLQHIAGGFQRACPGTFSIKGLGTLNISGHDAFVAIVGCGAVQTGAPRSEVAIVVAVKGAADYYTIQWAERAPPANQPPVLDEAKWSARFKQLSPIKVCARVPNEAAPYPSCRKQI